MNTRQNYGSKRAESTPIEPSAGPNSFDPAHPWQIRYGIDVSHPTDTGYYIPSELEIILDALKNHREYLAQTPESESIAIQLAILDDTILELHNLSFEGLALRSAFISESNQR